jgi:hypothetical protein
VKRECTDSKSGRHIFRSFFQEDLDRVKAYQETEEYHKAMRKRALWTEPLFGEAKQFHQMRRFRLRRLLKVNIEGVMIAAGARAECYRPSALINKISTIPAKIETIKAVHGEWTWIVCGHSKHEQDCCQHNCKVHSN